MTWFERIPKVELHLHLEGAIPVPSLWELVQKYGGDESVPNPEVLQQKFVFRDFSHFIDVWVWKNQFLREYDDFSFAAEMMARNLAAQNILYAEVSFSPADYVRAGLTTQGLATAVRKGLSKVDDTEVALIVDLVRDFGPDQAMKTLHEASEIKDCGIVGVGIGGSEPEFPPEPFRQVFEAARGMGFRTTAHAGEAAGTDSIWGAIRSLDVDRIGHGTRAYEDPELIEYLIEHRIPLEMCPVSNVRTGVVSSVNEHPVRKYYEQGMVVTVSTDDPTMFGNSLAMEFTLLEEELGFSRDDIKSLILNAINSSWMPESGKVSLVRRIEGDENWLSDVTPTS